MNLNSRSVLIVEDEGIVATDLKESLVELGYDAFAIAASSEEALAHASRRCPDVVLMDIRIKGERDGIETASLMRERFGVPVVYLTAHADGPTVDRAKKTQPMGYLVKPVAEGELRSAIEIALYRHDMERRLLERERLLASTMHSMGDAVVAVDLSGAVTFMNAAAETLMGVTAAQAKGKPARDLLKISPSTVDAPAEPLSAVLQHQRLLRSHGAELTNVKSGESRTISDAVTPVNDHGQLLGAVMVFRDITEEQKLQHRLEAADRLASLGTMASGVAHEVNNPLAIMRGNLDFVVSELRQVLADSSMTGVHALSSSLLEALHDADTAGSRIGRIVGDLKAFAGSPAHPTTTADLNACITQVARATAGEYLSRATMSLSLGDVPRVAADDAKLNQVMVNLIINAAQAITPGAVDKNRIEVTTAMGTKGQVLVTVRDTGCGIPVGNLERIFEPFFTTKEVGAGSGLGLSIVHGVVTALGGTVTVESEVGKGSVFRLSLPAARISAAEQAQAAADAVAPQGRVMVIDDEPMVLRAVERILRGCQVVSVSNPRQALTQLDHDTRFDVILSDVMMPVMTGIEFYEALLTKQPELAQRVIFVSGGAVTPKMDAFLQSVPNKRLAKPFEVQMLVRMVRDAIAAVRQSSAVN